MHQAFEEIIAIGENAREALLAQIDNKDDSVAVMAATYSLKYAPVKSQAVLRRIAKDNTGIVGFGAAQAIQRWEEGAWQLE